MEQDVVCKMELIDLKPSEEKKILKKLEKREYSTQDNWNGRSIRKNYLGGYDSVIIDVKNPRHIMSLVEVKVDKENNTLQGIQVLVIGPPGNRTYMFKKYTFSLDDYRKTWRGYTGYPPINRPWRGRTYG